MEDAGFGKMLGELSRDLLVGRRNESISWNAKGVDSAVVECRGQKRLNPEFRFCRSSKSIIMACRNTACTFKRPGRPPVLSGTMEEEYPMPSLGYAL